MNTNRQNGNVLVIVLLSVLIFMVVGFGLYAVATRSKDNKIAPTAQKNNSDTTRTITEWGVSGDVSGLPTDVSIKVTGDIAHFSSAELDTKLKAINCDMFCVPAKYFYTIEREKGGVTLPNTQKASQEQLANYIKIGDYYYYPGNSYPGSWPSDPTIGQQEASKLINQYSDGAKTFLKSLK